MERDLELSVDITNKETDMSEKCKLAMCNSLLSMIQSYRNASTQAHQDGERERGRELWKQANIYQTRLDELLAE